MKFQEIHYTSVNMREISIKLPFVEARNSEVLMSGQNRDGDTISVNRQHFIKNGLPWFPVAGEFHYSRYPSDYWKEALQKAKAGGLEVIATYVFWIHHEEIEGQFKWQDRFNVKEFITLCNEVGLKVILRIGPWDHGEVRNGGYPDWLFDKTRAPGTNDSEYLKYSKRLYQEIYNQVQSLFYKDNGPIIGIQIDNEYGHCHGLKGAEGIEHMKTLKNMALEIGFDVPIYTATGWGGAVVVEGEFLPLMAAYVEGSWEQHIDIVPPNINYVFTSVRDDLTVGSDLAVNNHFSSSYNMYNYPFATCELGGGMQSSYQRRPIITREDTEAMAFVKLGSGAIMLGYYMYQGGTNPMGELTTLQETRATGFPNDLPKLTYDYQAPLGEYGQRNPSYHALRRIHLFAKDQEEILTLGSGLIPMDKEIRPDDPKTLRYAIRYLGNTGFIFINNYQHNQIMEDQENLVFMVEFEDEVIEFPAVHVKSGQWRLLPFNLELSGIILRCATMQPLTSLNVNGEAYYFFYGETDQDIEYHFDNGTVKEIISAKEHSIEKGRLVLKQTFNHDNEILSPIILSSNKGERINIITLTKQQATSLNRVEINDSSYILISEADTYMDNQQVQVILAGGERNVIHAFPTLPADQKLSSYLIGVKNSIFDSYNISFELAKPNVSLIELGLSSEGHLQYELKADRDFMDGCSDVFLTIDFEGDIAELSQDGVLKADWFYNGLTWKIGLKRFAKDLCEGNWLLDISPLTEDAYVYLEKWPELVEGRALKLSDYQIIPEYKLF